MNSVKILHCADIHIGALEGFLGAAAQTRRYETLMTFERIVDTALQNGVQLLLIAGDLFDSNDIPISFADKVFEKIASVPTLKTVYCAGNHDPLNALSPFVTRTLPENLYVLKGEDSCFTFDDIKTRVYGRSFETVHLKGEEFFSLDVLQDDYINILLQHGDLCSDLNSDYNAITPRFVASSKMDYIALGHVHKRSDIGKLQNTFFAYCGCPEGQGFDELEEKGVYMGTISKGECNLEFIPMSRRQHIHEKIDITEADDIFTCITDLLKEKYGEKYGENLYKIELTGSIPDSFILNTSELTARLSDILYFVKIKDSTQYKIDLEALANETGLKGIFVKNMLNKINENPDNPLYKNALNLGLKAFNTEVNYYED